MDDHYASKVEIPDYVVKDHPDYVTHAIEHMKRDGAIKIFEQIYSSGHPVVVETHLEQWQDFVSMTNCYALHYRLTAVQTRHFVMPVFEFTNHSGFTEWKCPACGMVNSDNASFCGEKHKNAAGCGRPKGGL